jgi:hypothetical protein
MTMRFRPLIPTLFGALLLLAACTGGTTLEPSGSGNAVLGQDQAGPVLASKNKAHPSLVYCKPFDEAYKTATIGILGGTIKVGPHSLFIPPGALLKPKTITAKIVKNDYTNSVQLYPEGLKFIAPALLTLSYANCDKKTQAQDLGVVYTSDNLLRILELLPTVNNPFKKTTTGTIDHFSRYAIAF